MCGGKSPTHRVPGGGVRKWLGRALLLRQGVRSGAGGEGGESVCPDARRQCVSFSVWCGGLRSHQGGSEGPRLPSHMESENVKVRESVRGPMVTRG